MIETMAVQRNICIYSQNHPFNEQWCFSIEPVREQDMVYFKFKHRIKRRLYLKMRFFQNLKKVYLCEIGRNIDHFLNNINLLAELKVLMIREKRIHCKTLSSSSLEKFSLDCFTHGELNLDTPSLSSVILLEKFL